MDELDSMTPADLVTWIAAIRGGFPDRCDFCDQPTRPESLVSEEGGQWACLECWDRWESEDNERRKGERVGTD